MSEFQTPPALTDHQIEEGEKLCRQLRDDIAEARKRVRAYLETTDHTHREDQGSA